MRRRIITPEVRQSLGALIEYLWHDEQRDWRASGRPKVHIFRDVRRIAAWLDDQTDSEV